MAHSPLFRIVLRMLREAHRRERTHAGGLRSGHGARRWSRRRFIRAAAAAGGASALLPRQAVAWHGSTAPRITVVGAGIAGLNAAYQLQRNGHTAVVREARARVGGRVHTVRQDGLDLDLGGQWVNRDHADMRELAAEFGIPLVVEERGLDQLADVPMTAYFYDGRRIAEDDLAHWMRPIARQIGHDADRLDSNWGEVAPFLDRLSVADYLARHTDKLPRPLVGELLETSIRTEYGVEPQESSALQLIFNLATVRDDEVEVLGGSDETFSLEGGSARLTDALAAALDGPIHLGQRLQAILPNADGSYRLRFQDRDGGTLHDDADFVILALPPAPLRRVRIDATLSAEFRAFLDEIDLGRDEKVIAQARSRAWRAGDGFSRILWTDLGFSAAWDGALRQPDRDAAALVFFPGGDEVAAAAAGSARDAGNEFVSRIGRVVPQIEGEVGTSFIRTSWHLQDLTGGGYVNFRPGQLTRFAAFLWIEGDTPGGRQEVRFDRLVFVGEHLSDEFPGFMNGAAQTGRLGAEALLSML